MKTEKKVESKSINAINHINKKTPTILSDLVQSGFFSKIYTLFFMESELVFVKTGFGSTDIAGQQRAFHGGATAMANIASGIGKLIDHFLSRKRSNNAASIASFDSSEMVSAHKNNFLISYKDVKQILIKKPGWMGEMKITFVANKEYKFRVSSSSEYLVKYFVKTFNEFLPGKVTII